MNSDITYVPRIEVDLLPERNERCNQCENRFKCWTNKGFELIPTSFSLRKELGDVISVTAPLPMCAKIKNLVSTIMTIFLVHDNQTVIFKGIITRETITTDRPGDMIIEIEAKSRLDL